MNRLARLGVVCTAAIVGCLATVAGARQAPDPTLTTVLERAAIYVADYQDRFSLLVAEERYEQFTRRALSSSFGNPIGQRLPGASLPSPSGPEPRRVLKSDFLLVTLVDGGWIPYRDVFEVDGRKVRDRQDRLLKLLLNKKASGVDQAAKIMAESTRHNIGRVTRTINIPTLGMLLLHRDIRPRIAITHEGEAIVDGRRVWILDYKDISRPTLIRGTNGNDIAQTGRFWVDPLTGTIVKTDMIATEPRLRAQVTVSFAEDTGLGIVVPARMEENYVTSSGSETVICTATYSNYRRFTVSTNEEIQKPPIKKPPPGADGKIIG